MKNILSLFVAALALNVFSGVQVTKQYCDHNAEKGVRVASNFIEHVTLPTYVTNVVNNIYSNYYGTFISTNFYDSTGFVLSPDRKQALSGDLKLYSVTNSAVKKELSGFQVYSMITDESTGLHYVPMSLYDLSAVYIRYQCVENPLGTTGSGSSMRYKAGINVTIQASGVKNSVTLYNDSGTSLGSSTYMNIADIDKGAVKWTVGTHTFVPGYVSTFYPTDESIINSNDVVRILMENIPPPVPADRIYDTLRENRIAHFQMRREPYGSGAHSSEEYMNYEFDIVWTNYTTTVSSGKTIRDYKILNLVQKAGRTAVATPHYKYNETDGVGYFTGYINWMPTSADSAKLAAYAPEFVFKTNINWQISFNETTYENTYYFKLLSKREDCWNQYLKGDLKIYDSQDNVIGEVATKSNLNERVSQVENIVTNQVVTRLYNEAINSADSVTATMVYEAHYGGYAESVEGLYRLKTDNVYSESWSNIIYNLEFLGGTSIQDAAYPNNIKMEYNKVTRKFHLMATDYPTSNDGQFYNQNYESFFPMGVTNLVYTQKRSSSGPYPTVKFVELSHTPAKYSDYLSGDGTAWHETAQGPVLKEKFMTETTMRKWIQSGKILGRGRKVEYTVNAFIINSGGSQIVRGISTATFDTAHRITTESGAVFRGTIHGLGFTPSEAIPDVKVRDPELDLVYDINSDKMSLRWNTTNLHEVTTHTFVQKEHPDDYFPKSFGFPDGWSTIKSVDGEEYTLRWLNFYSPVESYMN